MSAWPMPATRAAIAAGRSRGTALAAVLMLLAVLALLAAAAVRAGLVSMLMTGGATDRAQAYQLAESVLTEARVGVLPATPPSCDEPATWLGPFSRDGTRGTWRIRWCRRGDSGVRVGDSYARLRNYEVAVEARVGRGARVRLVQGIAERMAQ